MGIRMLHKITGVCKMGMRMLQRITGFCKMGIRMLQRITGVCKMGIRMLQRITEVCKMGIRMLQRLTGKLKLQSKAHDWLSFFDCGLNMPRCLTSGHGKAGSENVGARLAPGGEGLHRCYNPLCP